MNGQLVAALVVYLDVQQTEARFFGTPVDREAIASSVCIRLCTQVTGKGRYARSDRGILTNTDTRPHQSRVKLGRRIRGLVGKQQDLLGGSRRYGNPQETIIGWYFLLSIDPTGMFRNSAISVSRGTKRSMSGSGVRLN